MRPLPQPAPERLKPRGGYPNDLVSVELESEQELWSLSCYLSAWAISAARRLPKIL